MVKSISITGSTGQLGFVTRARLKYHYGHSVFGIDRNQFAQPQALAEVVKRSDALVHLAGVIIADGVDLKEANLAIARQVTAAIEQSESDVHMVYASSVRIHDDTEYGSAKRAVGDYFQKYCEDNNLPYSEIVFPNLYGEFSKPNYNNVTGTFAHRVANDQKPEIHDVDKVLPLMSYLQAADAIHDVVDNKSLGRICPEGTPITLGALAQRLADMKALYSQGIVPDLRETIDLYLFNTLRINLFPQMFPYPLVPKTDNRGSFIECLHERNGGQVSFSSTKPGVTRGNHFHFTKVERFTVLSGEATIRVRKLYDEHVHEFHVTGDTPVAVDMPTFHTHNIENTGDTELLTLFWINESYDPENPDTYPMDV
ncbi:MAG: NAD-dependent epimerase/dehydratase family protein [Pseudomonadota bacterium]